MSKEKVEEVIEEVIGEVIGEGKVFVLDTNIFTNSASFRSFGKYPTDALRKFLKLASKSPHKFYITPGIYEEMTCFIEIEKISQKLLTTLIQRTPNRHEIKVNGSLLYELIGDYRLRSDKSLGMAERLVREAYKEIPQPREKGKPEPVGGLIKRLRDTYRHMMREGTIDSSQDIDLILLSKELGGFLVTSDNGLLMWAEKIGGIDILPFDHLKCMVEK